jgi:hypothetical protein
MAVAAIRNATCRDSGALAESPCGFAGRLASLLQLSRPAFGKPEDGNVPAGLIDRLAGAFGRLDDVASADLRDELQIGKIRAAGG